MTKYRNVASFKQSSFNLHCVRMNKKNYFVAKLTVSRDVKQTTGRVWQNKALCCAAIFKTDDG